MRMALLSATAALAMPALAFAGESATLPEWLFPSPAKIAAAEPPATFHTLPGSAVQATRATFTRGDDVLDWYPQDHPATPPGVLRALPGRPMACGYCHLPNGLGRPENASLAGLNADYIVAQAKAIMGGTRGSADPAFVPHLRMREAVKGLSDAELQAVASYFAGLPRKSTTKVVEGDTIPRAALAGFVFQLAVGSGEEPLGHRIVEGPDDFERFELRDPRMTYTAYVPAGSIAKGQQLAEQWGEFGGYACATCHGEGYRGSAIAPPLAGRSPTYIVRQLVNFRSGARHGGGADQMAPVAATMTDDDAIALAAFMAAQPVK